MSEGNFDPTRSTARRRWWPRLVKSAAPTAVWLAAIAVALVLYQRYVSVGQLVGYAEDRSITLRHLEPGVVRAVHVRLHEAVVPGQLLVQMDDEEERIGLSAIQKDIERLTAEVAAEKARLPAINAQAVADVEDLARRFLVDRETTHIEYLAQLMKDAEDRALLRGASVEYEIVRGLHEAGAATFRELNDAQTQVDSLGARVEGNRAVISRAKAAFDEADRRWALFYQREEVAVSYDPILTPLRLAVDVRQRDLEEVVRRIDAHVLRAPLVGQVSELFVEAGDQLPIAAPLLTVSPTSTSRVLAYLPERTALAPQQGAKVAVRRSASGAAGRHEYFGTIVSLSAVVSEMPPRYWSAPNVPAWGRALIVGLEDGPPLIPGEPISITLLGSR